MNRERGITSVPLSWPVFLCRRSSRKCFKADFSWKHSAEKYNELYAKLRNLNRLLAWAHARAIENILEEVACGKAITDQFGDKLFVENAMMKKGRHIELIQRPKAEEDMAVAAASILARAEFLRRMYFLSQDFKIEIPKD